MNYSIIIYIIGMILKIEAVFIGISGRLRNADHQRLSPRHCQTGTGKK